MREMKDSGIEWIGEIPKEWKLSQVRYLFRIGRGRVIAQTEIEENGIYPVFSSQTKNNGCLGYINTYDFDLEQITWTTDGANAGTVFLRSGKHNCTNVCGTLQPFIKELNLKYQKYALEHIAFYHKRADTNGYKIMNNEMAAIHTIIPSYREQERIANYLDSKCSLIDNIIDKQQAIIEKLKEYKLSLITECVTKGLNPDVEMKDSGYEYIGLVPHTWEICRLRNIGIPQNGISKGAEFFGEGYPFVSYGDIYRNYSLPQNVNGLIMSTEEEREKYSVKENDIFFTRTSETIEEVGFSSICEKTIPNATYAGFVIRVRPMNDKLTNGFAKYYFRGEHHRIFLAKEMNLVTRASLGQDLLKSMPVLVPPKAEQDQIVDYLDNKCRLIDKNIIEKQTIIAKLQEYKKSLIYEVVTGKKEV